MGRLGTDNAARIWSIVDAGGGVMTEAQMRKASLLGAATVNRMVKMLVAAGFMIGTPVPKEKGNKVVAYRTRGRVEDVKARFCRGPSTHGQRPREPKNMMLYGQGIGRVCSIFQLGQA